VNGDEKEESKRKRKNGKAQLCRHTRGRGRGNTEETMNIWGTAETSKYMSKPLYYSNGLVRSE
jgi:hypothetical protein